MPRPDRIAIIALLLALACGLGQILVPLMPPADIPFWLRPTLTAGIILCLAIAVFAAAYSEERAARLRAYRSKPFKWRLRKPSERGNFIPSTLASAEPSEGWCAPQNALQIILGTEGNFETRKASGLRKTTHTFNVFLKNENRSQFLSNCQFYLRIADKDNGNERDYALTGQSFTLNPTEERPFSIVSYEEPAAISGESGKLISLHIPVIGPYYGIGSGWPWQLPVGYYVFSLFATSKESGRAEVVCKIWVDADKKLHFTRA